MTLTTYLYIGKDDKSVSKDITSHKIKNKIVEKEIFLTETQPASEVKIKAETVRVKEKIILPKHKAQDNISFGNSNMDSQDSTYDDIRQDSSLSDAQKQRLIEQKVYVDSQNRSADNLVVQKYTPEETENLLKNNLLLHSTK